MKKCPTGKCSNSSRSQTPAPSNVRSVQMNLTSNSMPLRSHPLPLRHQPSLKRSQKGGASDWMNSANDVYIRPDMLTKWSLKHIENSPVFHPLEYRTDPQFGTPTTGIYPLGIYYMNQMAQQQCANLTGCTQPGAVRRLIQVPKDQVVDNLKRAMMN